MFKIQSVIAVALLNIPLVSSSQNRCYTTEHTQNLIQSNPSYQIATEKFKESQNQWVAKNQSHLNQKAVVTIPVVVHVLYANSTQNISDAQIQAQIDVLNQDFSRTNPDANLTPTAFQSLAGNPQVQFCLAKTNPQGNPTNGINRVQTSVSSFSDNDNVKFSNRGGAGAWDVTKYFNIWVCNLGNGILGYAEFPTGSISNTYGVVIGYRYFGKGGVTSAPYNKGRTATHEVGHALGLYHIWGDDGGSCSGSDEIADTPNQADAYGGCPSFPQRACTSGNGEMFMNYMDYVDDACMNLFTNGQALRIASVLNAYPYNQLKNSNVCNPPSSGTGTTPNTCSNTNEPNETRTNAKTIALNTEIKGQIASATDKDYLKFTITQTSNITLVLSTLPADFELKLYNASGAQIGTSTNGSTNNETIALNNLAAGTYTAYVYGYSGAFSTSACYTLKINATAVGSSTGSTQTCTNSNEPNESRATATSMVLGSTIKGQIASSSDKDYLKFTTTATSNISIGLSTLPGDYDLRVYNAQGAEIGNSQQSGTNSESIALTNAPAGTYTLYIYGYQGANSTSNCYTLTVNANAIGTNKEIQLEHPSVLDSDFKVYPNPAHDYIEIFYKNPENQSGKLRITDLTGRTVLEQNLLLNAGDVYLTSSISHLPAGIYLVLLEGNRQNAWQKIMVE